MALDKLVDSGVLDAALGDIADVIRAKTGISGSFEFPDPNDLADAIDEYLLKPTGTKSITENGTNIDVAAYAKVDVSVSGGGTGAVTQDQDGYIVLSDEAGGGSAVSGYGKPYTMVQCATSGYAYTGRQCIYYDATAGSGNNSTRRSIWEVEGEHSIRQRKSSSDYRTESGLYPIKIPNGATAVSVTPNVQVELLLFFTYFDVDEWVNYSDTGYLASPIINCSIPNGSTHMAINIRVNSSNGSFNMETTPRYVDISFA